MLPVLKRFLKEAAVAIPEASAHPPVVSASPSSGCSLGRKHKHAWYHPGSRGTFLLSMRYSNSFSWTKMVTWLKEKTNADCPSGDGPSWQEKAHCVHRIQKGELLPAGLQGLHWLLPTNYQEGFCWPVFLRNKQHGSQVLGIRCHQPQSH